MEKLVLYRILLAMIGPLLVLIFFPVTVLAVMVYFAYATMVAKRCPQCNSWFIDRRKQVCYTCSAITEMHAMEVAEELEGPWTMLADDRISHGMHIALMADEFGVWHIGEAREDPMEIGWKILGRDM